MCRVLRELLGSAVAERRGEPCSAGTCSARPSSAPTTAWGTTSWSRRRGAPTLQA